MTDLTLAVVDERPTWADVGAMVVAAVFGAGHAARERGIPLSVVCVIVTA
jgi:hypothetical protein